MMNRVETVKHTLIRITLVGGVTPQDKIPPTIYIITVCITRLTFDI